VLTGNAIVTTLVQAATVSATGNVNATGNISGGNIAITGNASAATAAADANTTQLATTAYVIGQASSTTPTAIGTGAVGTSVKYARADHTHTGVTSVNGSSGAVTGIATTAGNLAQFASTSSSQLAGIISDETGSGNLVFANTPTLVTPVIGAATGTSLSVSGNVTTAGIALGTGNIVGGNITGTHFGSGAGLSSLTGANVTGTVANATFATSAGSATSATNATQAANATTVNGTSQSFGFSTSNINVGFNSQAGPQVLAQGTGAAVISFHRPGNYAINMGLDTDNVFRIGGWSDGSNVYRLQVAANGVITGTATSARYADLAEKYQSDAVYEPGTVLDFGGNAEVTINTQDSSCRVAGVVSTNPAHLMNSMLEAEFTVNLALVGRVPTKVVGPVRKGDMMVSAGNGQACASATPVLGSVIGKALENFDGSQGIIEIVVGRM
jgi:hypothetical protein